MNQEYQACWQAARAGDVHMLTQMIKNGRVAKSKSMYQAIMNGHVDCVQFLLKMIGVKKRYLLCAIDFQQTQCLQVLDMFCQSHRKLVLFRTHQIVACVKAATRGDLETFKYLVANKYRMEFVFVAHAAQFNDQIHIIEYCVHVLNSKFNKEQVYQYAHQHELELYKLAVQHANPPFQLEIEMYANTLYCLEKYERFVNWNDPWWRTFLFSKIQVCQDSFPKLYQAIIRTKRDIMRRQQACNLFLPITQDVIDYCIHPFF